MRKAQASLHRLRRRIREEYERIPYPSGAKPGRLGKQWRVAPLEWIGAMCNQSRLTPSRILVAGCGTGHEAFEFQRRFPTAHVVGADFSRSSLAIARKLQQRFVEFRRVRFVRIDLSSVGFKKLVGGDFDLISCHGVLSYIPQPEKVLRNFAKCLTADGALYLGVNGAIHYSESWRPALRTLGFDVRSFRDQPRLRETLKMCGALSDFGVEWAGDESADYLASDLFGWMISNQPLNYWKSVCRRAGFSFLGSYAAHRALRPLLTNDLYEQMIPRSRAQVHELVEQIAPSRFHKLVFTRNLPASPPWHDPIKLNAWGILSSPICKQPWPKTRGLPTAFRNVTIKSRSTNTVIDLHLPRWLVASLRQSRPERPIKTVVREVCPRVSLTSLRKHLYLLHLLALINLHPPARQDL